MNTAVQRLTMTEPPVNRSEILRYAGASPTHAESVALMESCLSEMEGQWRMMVCYRTLPVKTEGERCDFGAFTLTSASLAVMIGNAREAVVMAATVGMPLDRLLQKYARTCPSRAVMLQAIGTERIEAVCDAFCAQTAVASGGVSMPRFSPGYGDLPLEAQTALFRVLDCPRQIGVSLTDSLMMTPSKSVTAVAVVSDRPASCFTNGCRACGKRDCTFRGDL